MFSNTVKALVATSTIALVAGCSNLSIGEEEFDCPGFDPDKDGVVCKSAREVYELTNHRDNLNGITYDEAQRLENATGIDMTSGFEAEEKKREKKISRKKAGVTTKNLQAIHMQRYRSNSETNDVPESADSEPLFPQTHQGNPVAEITNHHMNTIAAPEAGYLRQEAKVLRVLFNPWTDKEGRLNMPGYLVQEIEESRWVIGREAVANPSRIIPLQIRQASQSEQQQGQQNRPFYPSTPLQGN